MDLIYTNAAKEDQGVLFDYEFDLAFGLDENNFECTVAIGSHCVEVGSFIYIEGTEYGGIVDSIKVDTEAQKVIYIGRTWHGILAGNVIEPESGYDYYVVTGEGNAVIAGLIDYLGLSSIFTASTDDSGIDVATYSFRYVDAYSGICKMLAEFDGKLRLKHEVDKVVLYSEFVRDYSEDDEWDSSQVDFTIQQNFRPTNHIVCLGSGNLRNRHVIHLFTDENGGIQPYATTDNPVGDSDYILDTSGKLLFGLDEVADVLDFPSAQTYENYIRLSEQPSDWAKNYASYFKLNDEDTYVGVEGVPSEEVTLLTAEPADWADNYAAYHYYKDEDTLRSVEAQTYEDYRLQTKKPVDWETNYANYFVYWSDGLTEDYRAVSGVQKEKYVRQTMEPSDWGDNSNYYKYRWGDGYIPITDWVEWEPRRYYTKTSITVAPEWRGGRYFTLTKTTGAPAWEAGKYYTVKEVILTPPFASDIYFEKKIDHYAELVASGKERLQQAYNSNSISMNLDLDGVYDIGDIVGARENFTGLALWQPITKKIVTIKNGLVTISYKVGE